jgi:hypothetical protein
VVLLPGQTERLASKPGPDKAVLYTWMVHYSERRGRTLFPTPFRMVCLPQEMQLVPFEKLARESRQCPTAPVDKDVIEQLLQLKLSPQTFSKRHAAPRPFLLGRFGRSEGDSSIREMGNGLEASRTRHCWSLTVQFLCQQRKEQATLQDPF